MADQKKDDATGEGFIEKRREKRYEVPDRFQRYMTLRLKTDSEYVPANLANFSRGGILFESPVPLNPGSKPECILTLSLLIAREISFKIDVKYCCKNAGSYIVGASIDKIADESWFAVFAEIHDFIVLRKNSVGR